MTTAEPLQEVIGTFCLSPKWPDSAVKIVDLPRLVNENKCTRALFPGQVIRFHSNTNLRKIRNIQLANMRIGELFVPARKAIKNSLNSNGTELEQVLHTHRTS